MKKIIGTLTVLLAFAAISIAQDISGIWKTIDDETGDVKSLVEIKELDGKYIGKIIKLFDESKQDSTCDKCSSKDSRKDQKILGMVILTGLEFDSDKNEYAGGKILDPKKGKIYKSFVKLEGDSKLMVRGFLGLRKIGRTQFWHRQ